MAEIYEFADDEYFAKLPGVRRELRRTAYAGAARAEAVLDAHRAQGHSRITVTRGDILDYFINLDDTRGDRAAAAIEYGRRQRGVTSGVHALRSAF
ncbi:MAG TPA: DUF5403 family protein [Blastococcus sp.]|nr:DUF5403 family protein [Nocardioides sp.]HYH26966.1 DUF5403 family protein [Blastococcus sp.]